MSASPYRCCTVAILSRSTRLTRETSSGGMEAKVLVANAQ